MPSPDELLLKKLASEYVHGAGPGVVHSNAAVYEQALNSLLDDAMTSADPNTRDMAKMSLAKDFGPREKNWVKARRQAEQAAEGAFNKRKQLEQNLPKNKPQALRDMDAHGDAHRMHKGFVRLTGRLDQETARKSDIIRRMMRIIKTQPGLGMVLMALLGGIGGMMAGNRE